jgi:hypothetical protein
MDVAKTVTATFVPKGLPAAPSWLAAVATGQREVRLSWRDNSSNENTFRIELRRGLQSFREGATVDANVTQVLISNLDPGTRYYFRIRARNASGFARYSNQAIATTPN